MATRYYIVGGAYYTWEQLHNQFGYTDHETSNISYKSAHPTTWGESAGSGYFDGDQTDMVNGLFWSDEDNSAWHTLDSLALDVEVYPADATDCAMEKDGVRSDAVSIESDGVTYYLIRNVWDSGWMSESEAAAEGWEPAQPGPVLPVVYTHTGTQTSAIIAPDASFDTGLTYDSNNLYIGETDDGLGDATRYGWEAEEGPEPPAYTEITLYMASGDKQAQKLITSTESTTMTTTAASSKLFSLYYDESLTQPFRYDYSNDYELGWYNSGGEWKTYLQSIYDMPATYTSDSTQWKLGYILYDTGQLWLVSNVSGSGYMSISATSIKVRIYPKEQQYYAGYFKGSDKYSNQTWSGTGSLTCRSAPNTSSYFQTPSGFPNVTIKKILTSSTMERNVSDFEKSGTTTLDIYHKVSGSVDSRLAVFTLDKPTYYSWLSLSGNVTCASGAIKPLLDANGNHVEIEPNAHYTAIGLIIYAGTFITTIGYLNNSEMGALDTSNPTRLCWKQTYGSVSISCVWYTKDYYIDVNFGDPVTIPAGYTVESVKCSRGYAFVSNVSSESSIMGQFVHYELSGEKVYFDDTDTALVGVGVAPALQIFALIDLNNSGYYVSTKSGTSASNVASASASHLNSGGYFVKGSTNYNDSNVMSRVASGMQTFPVYFNLSDSSGNWLYFCFNVPQTLWQFQNGTFTWLGDTTDMSDLAYWYNTRAVQINLKPITT